MGLEQNFLTEPVSKLPLRPVITASEGITARQAVRLMREKGLGCIVFVDQAGRPTGKFTERLLIGYLLGREGNLDGPAPRSPGWEAVNLKDPIWKVIGAMQDRDLRFVIVVDDDGRAVALTGQRGLCEYIADHFARSVLTSRVGGKPAMKQREGA